ncbi:MAG: DNA translocase FtsK, partial [Candidatus Heimdallarchaeaceae archaeon]
MYKLPNIQKIFLNSDVSSSNPDDVKHKGMLLEETLKNFNISGTVVNANIGPVITQYEIKLAKGVKSKLVSNISNDLAIALEAESIRVLTPIPGKNTIGVEIPNDVRDMVHMKNILKDTDVSSMKIPMVIGKDSTGNNRCMDLAKAPHLLIAGTTGSGKSVGINVLLSSILTYKTPDEVQMVLIDPKMVELKPYEKAPHVIGKVITESSDAIKALSWAVDEMERRYQKLMKVGVRNIDSY